MLLLVQRQQRLQQLLLAAHCAPQQPVKGALCCCCMQGLGRSLQGPQQLPGTLRCCPAHQASAPSLQLLQALLREALGEEGAAALDRFDRAQLADVIRVCRATPTLSAAGRALFAVSRAGRTSVNDADRLRKYLARHGLSWELLHPTA